MQAKNAPCHPPPPHPHPTPHPKVPDVERFMVELHMQCPMAAMRLLHSGLPATIEHKGKQR